MIILVTDFGVRGPYVGQMKAVLFQQAPGVPIVDLFADAPAFEPKLTAYLLAAYVREFPKHSVFLCVVDPGVGNVSRRPVIVNVDDRWFVGPDNGLFNVICTRAENPDNTRWWEILWTPEKLSSSFHGRDLFAPVAAQIAAGKLPLSESLNPQACIDTSWESELARIIYIDAFGNAMTGIRAAAMAQNAVLLVNGKRLPRARTFSDVPPGTGFYYENANGLLEVAVNQGRAEKIFNLKIGDSVSTELSLE